MGLEKAKLFLAKSKFVKISITLSFFAGMLYVGVQLYYRYYSTMSETTKGIVGTLLGAFVGGCFTLAGSFAVNKSLQKAENSIRIKNVIYKPLYDELMEIHSEILKENPYPQFIAFEKGPQPLRRHPQYTVWGRIRKDARIFEVPEKLKKTMEDLYKAIEVYQIQRGNAVVALDQIYRRELKRISNRQIPVQVKVGDEFLANVLSGIRPDNRELLWLSGSSDEKNEADELWESLQKRSCCDEDILKCKEAKKTWEKVEEDALELLGIYIQYIFVKYEA